MTAVDESRWDTTIVARTEDVWADALIPVPMTQGRLVKIGHHIYDLPPRPADAAVFPHDGWLELWFAAGMEHFTARGDLMSLKFLLAIALANGLE